jgi:polyhydroxyalkanoate synthesis regulator phasin
MTELEKQLLNAFESLQAQHEQQHSDFVKAYNNLHQMFEITSKENATLRREVSSLSEQVSNLSGQLQQLAMHYRKSSR